MTGPETWPALGLDDEGPAAWQSPPCAPFIVARPIAVQQLFDWTPHTTLRARLRDRIRRCRP